MKIVNNYEELINFSISNPKTLCVIDFYATWCNPCKLLNDKIEKWHNMYPDITFFKINVEDENHENTCNIYNISSLPSILFLKNGETLNLISGFQEEIIHNNILTFM